MKKIALSLALCAVAGLPARLAATTFTVNNNNPSPGQYSTINDAIGAAAAGDTILVTGTPHDYGFFTVTKNNLTFIGAGHRPAKDLAFSSFIQSIYFVENLNGCKIQGFTLNEVNAGVISNADNITVEFCLIRGSIRCLANCNNWTIKNCVFTCYRCCAIDSQASPGRSNIMILNNIFSSSSHLCNFTNENTGIIVSNNIFLKGSGNQNNSFAEGSGLHNAQMTNNIFYQISTTGANNCVFNNNLSYNAEYNELPPANCPTCTGTGNIVNQNPLFTTYDNGDFQYAHNYILEAGSPGKNAGADDTDLGVYGANNTFSETGEPPIPVVRTLTIANPSTAQGALLNVNVTISNPDPDQ